MLNLLPLFSAFLFAADNGEGGFYLGLILLLAGPIFYAVTYARYRNRGERHYHERETPVQMSNLKVYDTFAKSQTGSKTPTISGANSTKVTGTLANNQGTAKTSGKPTG